MRTRLNQLLSLVALSLVGVVTAQGKSFQLHGVTVELEDVTPEVDVYYRSMRFNRAAGTWNVEVLLSNKSSRTITGPLVYYVAGFTNTSGPLQPDGLDGVQPFYDVSATVADGVLNSGELSQPYTLSLGVTSGSPGLTNRIFASGPPGISALAFTRTLNDAGLPLPSVRVDGTGDEAQTDDAFGLATITLTGTAGRLRFSASGLLPVWRIANVTSNGVGVIPHPRLTRRDTNTVTLTPIAGGTFSRGSPPIEMSFTPGTFSQNTTARLTPLTGQTLPLFLPQGWSPLGAFWLELSSEPVLPGSALLTPWGHISPSESAGLVRLNTNTLAWEVLQLVNGNGTNAVNVALSGSGAYALVVADAAPIAPPNTIVGGVLAPSTTQLPDSANLRAGGTVTPSASPASRIPELVTATAEVLVTNLAGNLPSGTLLRGEVSERYTLRDGTRRFPALFDNFVVGYQRPGDTRLDTLRSEFPIRPLLLFGGEELQEAVVHMDLFAPGAFTGGILETNGGQVASEGLRVLAGLGDLLTSQAVQLKRLNMTNFTEFAGSNAAVVAAFEIGVNGVVVGRKLVVQLSGLVTNANFVLARVLARDGLYGLEPRERLHSDGVGNLVSDEPTTADRLPGLNGAGQYVLLKINPLQGLVSGIARNSSGQPAGGLPLRVAGQPWLTFSANDGAFKLLAPAGDATLTVTDLASGDSGTQVVSVPNPQTPVNTQLASVSSGPRVVSVTPTNNATGVSRVVPIVITFSEPVNPGTVIGTNIQLLGTNGTAVTASLTLNLKNTIATLLPIDPLSPSTQFTIQLSTNITDLNGLRLEGPTAFHFQTERNALDRSVGELVIHEPTNGLVRMVGVPGMAEPESPVIMENQTSGATATVLSKPDGSFDNFIEAAADDQLRVVIVNRNGTRNTFTPARQLFSDGSVGLFNGGGTIEVDGVGGGAALLIASGAIAERTRIKLEMVDSNELAQLTGNIPPDSGKLLGRALSVSGSGNAVAGAADVEFPVSIAELEALGLPVGEDPTNATYALVALTKVDGVLGYFVVNKMEYADGRLVTRSPPFPGAEFLMEPRGGALQTATETVDIISKTVGVFLGPFEFLLAPLVMQFQTLPVTFTGAVVEFSRDASGQRIATPLPGAVVTIRPNVGDITGSGRQGRLDPGQLYTVARQRGVYALVQPRPFIDPFNPEPQFNFALSATHPGLFGRIVYKAANPPTLSFSITDLIFQVTEQERSLAAGAAPGIGVSHAPAYPPAVTNAQVTVTLTHVTGAPQLLEAVVESVVPLPPETSVSLSDVTVSPRTNQVVTAQIARESFTVTATKAASVTLRLKAVVPNVAPTTIRYTIPFGLDPPVSTNIVRVDFNDLTAPRVALAEPALNALAVDPARPIRLVFNEPLDRNTVSNNSLSLDPPAGTPVLTLSEDQQELLIGFPGLQFGEDYQLKFGFNVLDLSTNQFDQDLTTTNRELFILDFQTAPEIRRTLPGVTSGGGTVVRGSYAYVLDRESGSGDGTLRVFDVTDPANPQPAAQHLIPGTPRDLALIPRYSFQRRPGSAVETKDLLAVSFGDVGASFDGQNFLGGGQFIRIFDISDPEQPVNLVTRQVTLSYTTVVPRLRWTPPMLSYLESGADLQAIGVINLQTLILGQYMTSAEFNSSTNSPGVDLNADGDFVDTGEELPSPDPTSPDFAGKVFSFTITDTTQRIRDFNYDYSHGYVGAALSAGRVKDLIGQPTATNVPAGYRTFFAGNLTLPRDQASFNFTNGEPKRLFNLFGVALSISNAPERIVDLAILSVNGDSGTNAVVVIEITDPTAPSLLARIPLEAADGFVQSVQERPDGLLAVATTENLLLLVPGRFGQPAAVGASHPALVSRLPSMGSGAYSFGIEEHGITTQSLGARSQLVQTPPPMEFISLPDVTPFDPQTIVGQDDVIRERLEQRVTLQALPPARFKAIAGVADSTLDPASSNVHYYVLIRAPGGDLGQNQTIDVLLESLNDQGYPLRNKGAGFPPVRAAAGSTLGDIQQTPRPSCDAPIRPLTAYRLSNDKQSLFYNCYLSKPFALAYESISKSELQSLQSTLDREILWSGHFLRATLDTTAAQLNAVGAFASSVDISRLVVKPGAHVVAETMAADYIMGPNPPPVTGHALVPGAFGMLSVHNSEVRVDTTDLVLPSRRMPIQFRRHIGAQDLYEGTFGRGWDFNYNQRLVELKGTFFDSNAGVPLVIRGGAGDEIGRRSDLLFHPGDGRVLLYQFAGTRTNPPPEIAADPLVASGELDWLNLADAFYLPPSGIFDFLVRFEDKRFARLEPDGTQYWYNQAGRLELIYHRYEKNYHELIYNDKGELVRIADRSVQTPRYLDIGYWRPSGEVLDATLDKVTPASESYKLGKICRLKDYTDRDLLFDYTPCGDLSVREGVEVTSAFADGATGRARTEYFQPASPKEQANDIQGVVAGSAAGAKLFAANAFTSDPKVPIVSAGDGAAGPVKNISLQHQNTAEAVANGNARTTVIGADDAVAEITLDTQALPREMKFTGYGTDPATVKYDYTNGLLARVTHPQDNSIIYSYDFGNSILRSRGNLIGMKREPGSRPGDALPEAAFSYDDKYNLPSGQHKDFSGNTINYALNSQGKDVGKIQYTAGSGIAATSGSEEFKHNDHGQLTSFTSIEGYEITYDNYDAKGFLTSETRLDAGTTSYSYTANASGDGDLGLPTKIIPPAGAAINLTYNEREELTLTERAGKQREERSYDLNGRLVRLARKLDAVTTLVETRRYLQNGFLTNVTHVAVETGGSSRDLTYEFVPDQVFRVKEIRHPTPVGGNGQVVTRFEDYDHLGRYGRMSEGEYSETYTYDLNGNLLTVKRGSTTDHYDYDGYDRLEFERKEGQSGIETTEYKYYGNDDLKSAKLTDGQQIIVREIQYGVDAVGRLSEEKQTSNSGDSTTSYDHNGLVLTITDPVGEVTTLTRDKAARVTRSTDSIQTVDYFYDGNDNPLEIKSSEAGNVYQTFFEDYNDLEQYQRTRDNEDLLLTLAPRYDGVMDSVKDARNGTTDFNPTKLGEVGKIVKPNGIEFHYQYDEHRRVSSVADRLQGGHKFQFDDTLRLKRSDFRTGGPELVNSFDPRHRRPQDMLLPGGQKVLAYDPQGRITSRTTTFTLGSRVETFTRDPLGRVLTATYPPNSSVTYEFDKLGPLRKATYTHRGETYLVDNTIRADGGRTSLTYPSPETVTVSEGRDTAGRLTNLTVSAGVPVISGTTYEAADLVGTRTFGNNTVECRSEYDRRKRLTARTYTSNNGSNLLAEVRYVYDPTDNIVARQNVHRAGRTDFYGYDSGHRLLRADVGVRPQVALSGSRAGYSGFQTPAEVGGAWAAGLFARSYGYDVGNGLDVFTGVTEVDPDSLAPANFARVYGPADGFLQIGSIDGVQRPTDALGNTLRARLFVRPDPASNATPVTASLVYDGLKQLSRVDRDDGVSISYDYQHDGLRFHRTLQGGSFPGVIQTTFVHDDGLLIAEYDRSLGNNELRARYYYADSDVPVAADIRDIGGVLRRYYLLSDALGSIIGLVDTNGTLLERYFYDAWGQPEIQTPDATPPRIRRILTAADGNGLVVEFTERVLPALLPALNQNLRASYQDLTGAFQLDTGGPTPLTPTVVYEENLPGFAFGTALRLLPGVAVSGNLTLSLQPGRIIDEWNNPNATAARSFTFNAAPGSVLFADPNPAPTDAPTLARSAYGNPFLFHGQYFDYDAGLIYMRARFYDPASGLFLQQDPEGYEDSVNHYAGFAQNPTTLRDPSGRAISPHVLSLLDEVDLTITRQATKRAARSISRGESTLKLQDEIAIQRALVLDELGAAKEVRSVGRPPRAPARPPKAAPQVNAELPAPVASRHAGPPAAPRQAKTDRAGEPGRTARTLDDAAPGGERVAANAAAPGRAAQGAPAAVEIPGLPGYGPIRPGQIQGRSPAPAAATPDPPARPAAPEPPAAAPAATPTARQVGPPSVLERLEAERAKARVIRAATPAQPPARKAMTVDMSPEAMADAAQARVVKPHQAGGNARPYKHRTSNLQ